MKKELIELTRMAKEVNRPEFIQASGGNLSVKIDKKRMLVKTSGLKFSELSPTKGFVLVNFAKLRRHYSKKRRPAGGFNDKKETQFLLSCVHSLKGRFNRPSMEAGFHAFLRKYVLHTHSVYVNVLVCSKTGPEKLPEIFKDFGGEAVFLPYFQPGAKLAAAIGRLIMQYPSIPKIIFLKNHGLIISADSAEEVLKLHEKINERTKKVLNLKPYPHADVKLTKAVIKQFNKTVLFPDQAILGHTAEILNVWTYIINSLWRLKMSVSSLPARTVNYLKNMEAEKHRQKLHYSQR